MNDTRPARNRRPWVPIVVGILIGIVLLAVAAIGGGIYWLSRHIDSQPVSTAAAAGRFATARARFAGQEPLIALEDNRAVLRGERADGERVPIKALHVLAYDDNDGRLVHVDIPGWLLRLLPGRSVTISDVEGLSMVRSEITVEDLERRGPGLLLDTTTDDGSQVLIWTE